MSAGRGSAGQLVGSGQESIALFFKKHGKKLHVLPPKISVEDDWKLMTNLSGLKVDGVEDLAINFVHFERWWKYRLGLLEAETPVVLL